MRWRLSAPARKPPPKRNLTTKSCSLLYLDLTYANKKWTFFVSVTVRTLHNLYACLPLTIYHFFIFREVAQWQRELFNRFSIALFCYFCFGFFTISRTDGQCCLLKNDYSFYTVYIERVHSGECMCVSTLARVHICLWSRTVQCGAFAVGIVVGNRTWNLFSGVFHISREPFCDLCDWCMRACRHASRSLSLLHSRTQARAYTALCVHTSRA